MVGFEFKRRIQRPALDADAPEQAFEGRELAGLEYVRMLTKAPADLTAGSVQAQRSGQSAKISVGTVVGTERVDLRSTAGRSAVVE